MSDPYSPTLTHPLRPVASQQKVTVTLASTDAQQLTPTRYRFKAATFTAVKAAPNTPNAGDIYIGFDSAHQPIKLAAGLSLSISSGVDGWPMDLSSIWVKGTAADGLVVNFQEGVQ